METSAGSTLTTPGACAENSNLPITLSILEQSTLGKKHYDKFRHSHEAYPSVRTAVYKPLKKVTESYSQWRTKRKPTRTHRTQSTEWNRPRITLSTSIKMSHNTRRIHGTLSLFRSLYCECWDRNSLKQKSIKLMGDTLSGIAMVNYDSHNIQFRGTLGYSKGLDESPWAIVLIMGAVTESL